MHVAVVDTFNGLSNIITAIQAAVPNDQPLNQIWGWNMPSLTKTEIIKEIEATQRRLETIPADADSNRLISDFANEPSRIVWFLQNVMVNFAGGNAIWVIWQIRDDLARIDKIANSFIPRPSPPAPDWRKLAEDGYLPKKLADRFSAMEKRLEGLVPKFDDLESKIRIIETGYEVADGLPETISSLNDAKKMLVSVQTEAQSLAAATATAQRDSQQCFESIKALAASSESKFTELDDAYRAAATKGLAFSFQKKANDLGWSVRLWVAILMVALSAGAIIGYLRFEQLQGILSKPQTGAIVWGNLIFSIVSISPAIWLAWVATKQINQRFKLAEDYGFKATVASAYEAWKNEAAKQDDSFGRRLFGSALTRLEEAPLRFVEAEAHDTPWQEFANSPLFLKALEQSAELKSAYQMLFKKGISKESTPAD